MCRAVLSGQGEDDGDQESQQTLVDIIQVRELDLLFLFDSYYELMQFGLGSMKGTVNLKGKAHDVVYGLVSSHSSWPTMASRVSG